MRSDSLLTQIIAVLSRRTSAFHPDPGEPETFPDALAKFMQRPRTERPLFLRHTTIRLMRGSVGVNLSSGSETDADEIARYFGSVSEYTSVRENVSDGALSSEDMVSRRSNDLWASSVESKGGPNEGLRWATLIGRDLSGKNLSGRDLSDWDLSDASLSAANLSAANLSGANLSGANLSDANLSAANLSGANLSGTNFSGANLSDANLRGANLVEAYLFGVNLIDANMTGVNGLLLWQVGGARWSAATKWPYVELATLVTTSSRTLEDGNHEVVGDNGPDREHREALT